MTKVEEIIINEMSNETAKKIFRVLKEKDYAELDKMTNEELDVFARLLEASLSEKNKEAIA